MCVAVCCCCATQVGRGFKMVRTSDCFVYSFQLSSSPPTLMSEAAETLSLVYQNIALTSSERKRVGVHNKQSFAWWCTESSERRTRNPTAYVSYRFCRRYKCRGWGLSVFSLFAHAWQLATRTTATSFLCRRSLLVCLSNPTKRITPRTCHTPESHWCLVQLRQAGGSDACFFTSAQQAKP